MSDSLYARVAPYTKSSRERLVAMNEILHSVDKNKIPGDVVECGVWAGGNIILSRLVAPERVCWLYDTFTGMTAPGEHDTTRSGYSAQSRLDENPNKRMSVVSLDQVELNLRAEGVYDAEKLRFVVGDVCETLRDEKNLPDRVSVLRLDTDWYESTKTEMEVLYPRLSSGGVLIVDDYGHWMGARKAVDEYLGDLSSSLRQIDYTGYFLIKP